MKLKGEYRIRNYVTMSAFDNINVFTQVFASRRGVVFRVAADLFEKLKTTHND